MTATEDGQIAETARLARASQRGDRRRRGYGRYVLRRVEQDAQARGVKGVVAWPMDWDWNPVSF